MMAMGGWYDFQQTLTSPVGPLGISMLLWGVIIYTIGSLAIIGQMLYKEHKLVNALPSSAVKPVVYNERAILEIENLAGGADFTARARVISGTPEPELYGMYWEGVRGTSTYHIDGAGGTASILVGEIAEETILRDVKTAIYKGELQLFRMGTSGEQTFPSHTHREIPRMINGKEGIEITQEDKATLEVTITSSPQLKKSFNSQQYFLEIDREHGGQLLFAPMSIAKRINLCQRLIRKIL